MIFQKLIISSILLAISCLANPNPPTVVVIGAGIAGLTAGYRLQQQGIDVQIYEARNRVGGRIFTAKIDGQAVELGGQNIADGGNAENIHRLIDEFGLKLEQNRVVLNFSYFDGEELIPEPRFNKTDLHDLKSQIDTAAQRSQTLSELMNWLFEPEDLIYKFLSVRLAAYEGAPIEKLSPLYKETLYHMLSGGLCSAHPSDSVDLITIEGGNSLLPKRLAQSLGERVHLNMPLSAVSKNGSYDLTFRNGQKVKADILVLAIPCSTYENIHFEKALISEERLKSIKSVQYGTNAKILIPFSQSPLKRITLMNDRTIGFFDTRCKVLTLYYTGESGRFSSDTILETFQKDRPMLEVGFEKTSPFPPPIFARDEFLASYMGPIGYSWPNDPYAKGSYSYIAPGQEKLLTSTQEHCGEIVKSLFAPIDRSIYFAGEHASILTDVSGTMEAACESGERTARMILKELSSPAQHRKKRIFFSIENNGS